MVARVFGYLWFAGALFSIAGSILLFQASPCDGQILQLNEDVLKQVLKAYDPNWDTSELRTERTGSSGYRLTRGIRSMKVQYDPTDSMWMVDYMGRRSKTSDNSMSSLKDVLQKASLDPTTSFFLDKLQDMFNARDPSGLTTSGSVSGSSTAAQNDIFWSFVASGVMAKSVKSERERAEKAGGRRPRLQILLSDLETEWFKIGDKIRPAVGFTASVENGYERRRVGAEFTFSHASVANNYSGSGYGTLLIAQNLILGASGSINGSSYTGTKLGISGGPFLAFRRYMESASISLGGMYQYHHVGDRNSNILIYGGTLGFYLGESGALNVSGTGFSEYDKGWNSFQLVGVSFTWMVSRNFGLTLGYRMLLGIKGYSSNTLTMGLNHSFF